MHIIWIADCPSQISLSSKEFFLIIRLPTECLPVSGPLTRWCASTLCAALLWSSRAGSWFGAYIQTWFAGFVTWVPLPSRTQNGPLQGNRLETIWCMLNSITRPAHSERLQGDSLCWRSRPLDYDDWLLKFIISHTFVLTHQIQARQTETITFVPIVTMLRWPKYGSSQILSSMYRQSPIFSLVTKKIL